MLKLDGVKMNKRYLAVVLISMTLLFASVQAFDYFEWDKQLFPTYDGTPKSETIISLSPASICGDGGDVTGTNTHDCAQYWVADTKGACTADPCCRTVVYGPPENWDCLVQLCSHADITNPDMCEGCTGCTGNWTIDDARGTLPWDVDVTGRCDFTNGATMNITSGKELTCETIRFYTTSYCRVYTGGKLRST